MAFLRSLFGGQNTKPDFTGLQIGTATAALPIPIIWGMTKLATNVVWYNNFQTTNPGGGKGGLFNSSSSSSYTYTADLIMALCEGPLQGINQIWKDQDIYTLAGLNLTLFEGTTPQATWGYLSSIYPNEAIAYQGTAYVCAASYQLGDSASIGNHNFEVVSADFFGTSPNGLDADPATVIYDFLTNPQYGAGFAAASINLTTLYGGGSGSTDGSLQAYCAALGIGISPALTGQETASSILARWLQICNCGAVWSGEQLKFIPYGDLAISTANLTQTVKLSVPQPSTDPNNVINPAVTVCSASLWVSDGGVKYAFTGGALTYSGGATASGAGTYGRTSGWQGQQYVFSPADEGTVVALTFTRKVPRGFTPDLDPVYSLTDTDFIATKPGEEPIKVSRLDPFTLPNIQRIQCCSRANQYGSTPVEARDQSQIELYGPRVGSTVTANEICDDILVAPIVAQTILQRGLYVRAHFKFGLSWEFCLLEPMDVVEITDAALGLIAYPVRITEIDEDETGVLSVTAEELTVGVSTPVQYPSASPTGWQANRGVAAAAVNTPLIYEPPPALTGNVAQIWLGASAVPIYRPGTITPAIFTGTISGTTNLSVSAVTGVIQVGEVLQFAEVSGTQTITAGSGSSWTISPGQGDIGPVTMVSASVPSDVYWGGAYIYASLDNESYGSPIGQITSPLRQGVLEANLAAASIATFGGSIAGSVLTVTPNSVNGVIAEGQSLQGQGVTPGTTIIDGFGLSWNVSPSQSVAATSLTAGAWDTADTLSVGLAESGGVLDSGSQTSAWSGAPLALVGLELIAYETATPSGPTAYALTGLQRGLYTTPAAAHSTGAPFARLDGAVFKYSVPANLIGQTLYFKFQSYNVFGSGLQQLSSCVAYSHALSGTGIPQPADITGFGAALAMDSAGNYTLVASWNPDPNSTSYQVQWSTDGVTWGACWAGSANSFSLPGWSYISLLYLRIEGVNGAFSSPTWEEITVSPGPQQTVDVGNAGLYVALNDLQAELADIVIQAIGLIEDNINIATITHVISLSGAITEAKSQIGSLGVSTETAITSLTASIGSVSATFNSYELAQATSNNAIAFDITSLNTNVGSVSAGLSTFLVAQSTWSSAVAQDVVMLSTSVGSVTAGLSTFMTAQSTWSSAVAQDIVFLSTSVGSVTAGLSTFMVAQSTWSSAVAVDFTSLSTSVGSVTSGLSTFMVAQSTWSSAVAQDVIMLSTSVGSVTSGLSTFMTAQSTWSSAVAQDITSLSTSVGSVTAGLSTFMVAQSTWSSAVAVEVTSLSTSVGANSASISTNATAISSLQGINAASYGIKLDVNGYITGFELLNGGTGVSAFTVRADEFNLIMPGYSSTRVMVASYVNGVASLAFNGNLIADGTVEAHSLIVSTAVITNTLQLGNDPYNVVTIPTGWYSATPINGSGGVSLEVETLTFTMDQPGFIQIIFSALQTYFGGDYYGTFLYMYFDGVIVTSTYYTVETVTAMLTYSPPGGASAGTHSVDITWNGAGTGDGISLSDISLIILGIKR